MRYTKDEHRAGTHSARCVVTYRIPLADPKAWGNWGLEGYDEDTIGRDTPNAGLARHWATKMVVPEGAIIDHARVETIRWEADGWDDDEYGYIQDAIQVVETVQDGYPDGEGGWTWEEPYAEGN